MGSGAAFAAGSCALAALAGSSPRWTESAGGPWSGALGAACDTIVEAAGAAAAGGGLDSGSVSRAAASAIGGATGSASVVAAVRGVAV
jgi:hypothetical protein